MATQSMIFNAADQTTPGYYGPSQTALLLLDFHTMFVNRVGGTAAAAALAVAAGMRRWAKSQSIPVIHCLIDIDQAPFPTCKNYDRFANIMSAFRLGGGEEPPELLDGEEDVNFKRKPGYVSALKSPGLEEHLREKGVKSLVLAGLSTSGCVTRTALAACDAEFVVTVISDGCADVAEDVHEMLVSKILNYRGYVATAKEFQEGFIRESLLSEAHHAT